MILNMDCIEGCKSFADESVDLIIADPPYNLGFGGTTQTKSKKPRFKIIANDQLSAEQYKSFMQAWIQQAYRILKPGRHIYVCIDWRTYPLLAIWLQHAGFTIKNCIVWNKERMGMGWQYRFTHEFILFATKGVRAKQISTRAATDVWSIPKIEGNKTIHPTEKPVKLLERMVLNSSEEGEVIVDFFSGSGAAGEAVLKHKRKLIAFEIDEHWYQVTLNRLSSYLEVSN